MKNVTGIRLIPPDDYKPVGLETADVGQFAEGSRRWMKTSAGSDGLVRPWLDDDGAIRPDHILREISKNWSAETWELFLVETVEKSGAYQREDLINPRAYLAALDEMTESIWECDVPADSDELFPVIRRLIRDYLTARQQQVIRLLFWEGLSERRAGDVIGIGRSTVASQKHRSFKKLKGLIERRESIFRLVERGRLKISPRNQLERSRDQHIAEVYRQDLNGSYMK